MIINEKNEAKIRQAIKEANGRARLRTIEYEDVVAAAEYLEKRFGIAKSNLVGIKVEVDLNSAHFAKAYNGVPMSTQFTLTRKRSGWDISEIERKPCRSAFWSYWVVMLPQKAQDAIIRSYMNF